MNSKTFVRSHMDVMSVADFFTVEVWTLRGLVRYHVFFVINLAKRQVEVAHIGCQVNGAVMAQVARNMTDSYDGFLKGRRFFVCDHDPLYTKEFRQILTDSGVEVIQTRVGCPQQNGYAESIVSAIKRECIDHMIFFSEKSLRRAVGQYVEHFHHERNHQGLDNLIPFPNSPQASNSSGIDDGLGLFNFADQYLGNAPDQGAIEHGDSSLFPIRPIAISTDKYFVELSGKVGGSSTPVNVVLTTAALAGSLAYEVRMNNTVDWLSVAPSTGTLSPNSTQMLTLTLQTASLSSGDKLEATILVRFDDGFSIPITVNAEAL